MSPTRSFVIIINVIQDIQCYVFSAITYHYKLGHFISSLLIMKDAAGHMYLFHLLLWVPPFYK